MFRLPIVKFFNRIFNLAFAPDARCINKIKCYSVKVNLFFYNIPCCSFYISNNSSFSA